MESSFLKKAEAVLRGWNKRKRWEKTVTALAAVCVVLLVVYALIFSGLAMEGRTYCGKEEHRHTAECYAAPAETDEADADGGSDAAAEAGDASEPVLICGKEEHQHVDRCYVDPNKTNEGINAASEGSGEEAQAPGNIADRLTKAAILIEGKEYDGTETLNPGQEFSIRLEWEVSGEDLQKTNTYTYKFPAGVTADDMSEKDVFVDGVKKGSYSIKDNVLTFTYLDTDMQSAESFVEVKAKWGADAPDMTEIPWGSGITSPVKFDNSDLKVVKSCSEKDFSDDPDGSFVALCKVDISTESDTIKKFQLTDEMTSTSGKFQFYKGYFEHGGKKYDYRYATETDEDGNPIYQYANFEDGLTQPAKNGDTVTPGEASFGTMTMPDGKKVRVEYAVKIPTEARQELDQWTAPEEFTNIAKGSYQEGDKTISSSSTKKGTYRAENAWVKKERGTGSLDNVAPWKVVVNPDRAYGMGGAAIGDAIKTQGMVYITDDPVQITLVHDDENGEAVSETKTPKWITLPDKLGNLDFVGTLWDQSDKVAEMLFSNDPAWKAALAEMNKAVAPDRIRSYDDLSKYVFTNESKNKFIWFTPAAKKDKDGNEIPYTYKLEYDTDISNVTENVLTNSAYAGYKEFKVGDTPGSFVREVGLTKSNDGVVIDKDGRYLIEWTLQIDVPAGADSIPNVWLYDKLPALVINKVGAADWLMGLSSDTIDYEKAVSKDAAERNAYMNELTRGAFTLAVETEDEALEAQVKELLAKATTGFGTPDKGIDICQVYSGENKAVGQLKIKSEDEEYASKTFSAGSFNINLGDLPATKNSEDGYSIIVKYTTQANPYVVENTGSEPSGLSNSVELYQKTEKMATAHADYYLYQTENESSLNKQVESYDAETRTITYKVDIDPLENIIYDMLYYQLQDSLNLPGAKYVEDSFVLRYGSDVSSALLLNEEQKSLQNGDVIWRSGEGDVDLFSQYQAIMAEKEMIKLTVSNEENDSSSFALRLFDGKFGGTFAIQRKDDKKLILAPMTLTYQVQLPEKGVIEETTTEIQNTVSLHAGYDGELWGLIDADDARFDFNSAMHKQVTTVPSSGNGYSAEFTIDIDKSKVTEENDKAVFGDGREFTVFDKMSKTLSPDSQNIVIYGIEADGHSKRLDTDSYTVGLDTRDTQYNYLNVTIADKDAYERYRIVYRAHLSGSAGDTVSYSNEAGILGTSVKSEEVEEHTHILSEDAGIKITNLVVDLYKFDADDVNAPLDATFTLYEYNEEEKAWKLVKEGVKTGDDGKIRLGYNTDYPLQKKNWYKLEETKAPAGYVKATAYFYMGGVPESVLKVDGVEIQNYTSIPVEGGSLDIPNYKASLRLSKVDSEDSTKRLSGAEFRLYEDESCKGEGIAVAAEKNGVYEFTLGDGIKAGQTYYLKEITAPEGYACADTVFTVKFDKEGNAVVTDGENKVDTDGNGIYAAYLIPNKATFGLPETGGAGTVMLYGAGAVLVIGAALLLVKRRRRAEK